MGLLLFFVVLAGVSVVSHATVVGNITSAGYAHSVGGQVAMGYINDPDAATKGFVKAGEYHIDAGGTLLDAVASLRPLVDPKRRVLGDYT